MRSRLIPLFAAILLAACGSPAPVPPKPAPAARPPAPAAPPATHAPASNVGAYKELLARHIHDANPADVFSGQPHSMLRSVIVMRVLIDSQGGLEKAEILRSNRDRQTEATALASLRGAAPFPRPAPALLARGKLELVETWLFNREGRFQLRTIAEPQARE